jgi:O-antigen ligase
MPYSLFSTVIHQRCTVCALALASLAATIMAVESPLYSILVAIAIIGSVIIFTRPEFGLYAMFCTFEAQNSPLWSHLGSLGAVANDSIGVVTLCAFILRSRADSVSDELDGAPRMKIVAFGACCLYFGWFILSTVWSTAPTSDIFNEYRVAAEAVLTFGLAMLMLRDRSMIERAALCYAAVAVALGIDSIVAYRSASNIYSAYRAGFVDAGVSPNGLAIDIALSIPLLAIGLRRYSPVIRWAGVAGGTMISSFALVVLASRGAILGLALGVLLAIAFTRGVTKRGGAILAIAIAIGVYFVLSNSGAIPLYAQKRLNFQFSQAKGGGSIGTLNSRLPIWQAGLQQFQDNPIAGTGLFSFETNIQQLTSLNLESSHNDFVAALADGGIVGGVALLILLLSISRLAFLGGPRPELVIIAAVILASMWDGSVVWTHDFWAMISLFCCAGFMTYGSSSAEDHDRASGFQQPGKWTVSSPGVRFKVPA